MALFLITTKNCSGTTNGIKVENGMTIEVISKYSDPINTNGGHEVIDAFQRKYGIDIKKAAKLSKSYLDVKKIN
ncbi:MAG: hypothetical protein KAT68_01565 [Bacteroidales bacterium]|nr:hypothetical protein [Bacteroidales bacterium]